MSHNHHHHTHEVPAVNANRAFVIGIALNLTFVAVEFAAGIVSGSLSLLSDAGHNLTDVATLALSLLAFRLMKVKTNERYTYGYRKTSILVALFNSIVLVATVGWIAFEAGERLLHPQPVPGFTIALVAGAGTGINLLTAFLFLREKEKDLNIKSAYIHLIGDALISLAVVFGGILIHYTGQSWIDPALSLIVAGVILWSTWGLLKDSLQLSLDGVPAGIDLKDIEETILAQEGVCGVHHIHVWAMSTTENAMTAHLVLSQNIPDEQELKEAVRHALFHRGIHHATLETETQGCRCRHQGDAEV